jgi:hypothetical protein
MNRTAAVCDSASRSGLNTDARLRTFTLRRVLEPRRLARQQARRSARRFVWSLAHPKAPEHCAVQDAGAQFLAPTRGFTSGESPASRPLLGANALRLRSQGPQFDSAE